MSSPTPTPTPTARGQRLSEAHLVASLCLTLLTAVTVIAMSRVFADWAFLRPMLAVGVGIHLLAFVLRLARAPLWVALPVLLVAMLVVLGLVYYRDTLSVLLPTGRTIDVMRLDLRLVVRQFPSAVAPVPSQGSFATAAAAVVAVAAILADTFSFRAFGRVESVVPTGVLFVFTSALGVNSHRVLLAALWVGCAFLTIAMLRFDHSDHGTSWMGTRKFTLAAALPAIAVTVAVSAVAALAVAPRLPGAGEKALIDTRNRQGSVTEVLSPLVDIRARMKNNGGRELFTVQSSDGGHYWREISLPNFDGNKWSPPGEDLSPLGDRSSEVLLPGTRSSQEYVVKALGGSLVPAAYRPVQVSPGDRVLWAAGSQSLVLPDNNTLQSNDRIRVDSVISSPTADQLRASSTNGADPVYYQLPPGMPNTALKEATRVVGDAPTAYDKAIALQRFFQTQFTYDLDVQLGESSDAIAAFLRDRRGFCQQFAGTFAVMARSLHLPARVAVGYTQGDLGSDGLFHVFGRHAHAWPEVWFDNVGWVAFEPTPGRGNPDGQAYTGLAPQQDNTGGSGSTTDSTAPVATNKIGDPDASTTLPGSGRPGQNGSTTTTVADAAAGGTGSSGGSSSVPLVLLGLIVLLTLWVLLAPRVLRTWNRSRGNTARDRVVAAWQRACHLLSMAGAPPVGGATPLEYADVAMSTTGVDQGTLRELAVQVTRAVYSPRGVDDAVAAQCERLEAEVDAMCKPRIPMSMRLRSLVDPRLMRRRITG